MNSIIKKLIDVVLLAVFAFGLTTCKKETIAPPTVRLFGDGPSSINITSAGVSAEVIDQGGAEVISRGFAYGLSGGAMDTVFCGSGTGPFSTNLNNLQPNTPYVYEAFAKNAGGFGTSGKVSFTTKDKMKPTVKTGKQVSVTTTTATIGDNKIMDEGGDPIIERGVRYGTDSTQLTKSVPAIEDIDVFTSRLTDLTPNATYYYQAYAKNSKGPGYGLVEHFTANPLPAINLIVSASPSVIAQGGSSRLKVEPSGGNGSFTYQWDHASSLDHNNIQNPTATPTTTTTYTCTVTSGNQTANGSCTVTVVCKPTGLTATTSGNNVNLTWTAPNSALNYKYNIYRNNTLIKSGLTTTTYPDSNLGAGTYNYQVTAVYNNVESPKSNKVQATIAPQAPTGAINGVFSVSASQRVYFSQGNLQYRASDGTWRFATNQYDCIGSSNSSISSSYSGWIDLFGWGTSGWNCGNTYYKPWNYNNSSGSLYGPPGQYNLTGSYANSDWGRYNAISNGGNQAGVWRTLTQSEWDYVFNQRNTTSGKCYAKAWVNGLDGVILLPDDWNTNYYSLSNYDSSDASYSSNVIDASTWRNSLEAHGCVFLPVTGYRYGTSVYNVYEGYYWSASYSNISSCADYVHFSNYGGPYAGNYYNRYYGLSVRLVRSVQ